MTLTLGPDYLSCQLGAVSFSIRRGTIDWGAAPRNVASAQNALSDMPVQTTDWTDLRTMTFTARFTGAASDDYSAADDCQRQVNTFFGEIAKPINYLVVQGRHQSLSTIYVVLKNPRTKVPGSDELDIADTALVPVSLTVQPWSLGEAVSLSLGSFSSGDTVPLGTIAGLERTPLTFTFTADAGNITTLRAALTPGTDESYVLAAADATGWNLEGDDRFMGDAELASLRWTAIPPAGRYRVVARAQAAGAAALLALCRDGVTAIGHPLTVPQSTSHAHVEIGDLLYDGYAAAALRGQTTDHEGGLIKVSSLTLEPLDYGGGFAFSGSAAALQVGWLTALAKSTADAPWADATGSMDRHGVKAVGDAGLLLTLEGDGGFSSVSVELDYTPRFWTFVS